jgi:hypothetical protein
LRFAAATIPLLLSTWGIIAWRKAAGIDLKPDAAKGFKLRTGYFESGAELWQDRSSRLRGDDFRTFYAATDGTNRAHCTLMNAS